MKVRLNASLRASHSVFDLSVSCAFKAFLVLALAAVALARPDTPRPYAPPSPYKPAPAYKQPAYEPVAPPKYEYAYAVKDDYSGVDFDQNENRDGYATSGVYRVALPDGRIQVRESVATLWVAVL